MVDINDCKLIQLQNQIDERGGLVIAESTKEIPFDIRRVFYSFNIPDRKSRGSHAHRTCGQVLTAPTGCYNVLIDDGVNRQVIVMDDPLKALYVPAGIWAEEFNFEPSAICLVMASDLYDESDYIRDYEEYKKYRGV